MLAGETEGLFTWQFGDAGRRCPRGCVREGGAGGCVVGEEESGGGRKDEL